MDSKIAVEAAGIIANANIFDANKVIRDILLIFVSAETVKFIFEKIVSLYSDVRKQNKIDSAKAFLKKRISLFECLSISFEDISTHAAVGNFQEALDNFKALRKQYSGKISLYMSKKERKILSEMHDVLLEAMVSNSFSVHYFQNTLEKFRSCLR